MKKRFWTVFLSVILSGALAACAESTGQGTSQEPAATESTDDAGSTESSKETAAADGSDDLGVSEVSNVSDNTDVSDNAALSDDSAETDNSDSKESGDMTALKNSINTLNWKLYNLCDDDKNLFYSPYSIGSAFAMVDMAAGGETKEGIEKALSISDLDELKERIKEFRERENTDTAKLTNVSSVWLDKSLKLSENVDETFIEPAKLYFGGSVESADFEGNLDEAKSQISEWVSKNTEDMISDYEPIVSEVTKADIINAIYFYGEWESKFAADRTVEGADFRGLDAAQSVSMMNQSRMYLKYLADEQGMTAAALPYADSAVEMDVIMTADEADKLSDVWKLVDKDSFFAALDNSPESTIDHLSLPKFTMDETYENLKDQLIGLGMDVAFSDDADFSGLSDEIKISNVAHQAKLEVDEEGSRAAAVTEIMLEALGAAQGPTIEFIVDRPFIFVIRDVDSGVILFTGRVNNL